MGNQIFTQKLAKDFCQDTQYLDALVYVEQIDSFLLYNESGGYYKILSERQLEHKVIAFILDSGKSIGKSLVRDMVYLIKMFCYKQLVELPRNYVALRDKLLNLNTFEFEDFSMEKYAYHVLPVYSVDVSTSRVAQYISSDQAGSVPQPTQVAKNPVIPQFLAFLRSILVTEEGQFDTSLYLLVQEMFGFYLLEELKPEVVFFLVGHGANGKSKLIEVLTTLIGSQFTTSLSIQSMTTNRFATASLIGKKLNVCSEEESKYMKSDKFKAMVSGDPVEAEWKYGATFSFRPRTKYLFATNAMPTFDSINHGLRRRLKIIFFHRVFQESEQDKSIMDKILPELPGILAWTIEGAKRLREQNYVFTKTNNTDEMIKEFEGVVSSAIMFVREQYVEEENAFIGNDELYLAYSEWCERNGRKKMNSYNFGKDINQICKLKSISRYQSTVHTNIRGKQLRLKNSYVP